MQLIPFKVRCLPPPENCRVSSRYGFPQPYEEIWIVVGVSNDVAVNEGISKFRIQYYRAGKTRGLKKSNTQGPGGYLKEPDGTWTHTWIEDIPCQFYLLAQEGKMTIWWPDVLCEVVGVPKVE